MKINNMTVYVLDDYEKMSKKAANILIGQVNIKPTTVLGLATGGTPVGMYKEIVKIFENGNVDFSNITTFNLDEYYPIDRSNCQSYYYYMNENLFKYINIDQSNINIPNGMAKDIEQECIDYENLIVKSGGIDLQVLGIGPNGHIGFNEPDDKFATNTHLVNLDNKTIEANSRFFNSIDEVPTKALSMGIKSIMKAKKIMLLANGDGKAEIIRDMIYGPITPQVPASILQLHNDVTIVLDKKAAKYLSH